MTKREQLMNRVAYVPPLLVLQARAEAGAYLYDFGDFFDMDEATAPLFAYAADNGIAEQTATAIIKTAFAEVAEL